jgi:outer membrane biosynthesis protein TonB
MYNTLEVNRNDRNKGARVSFVIHALLLLLIFFYYLPKADLTELEDKPPYAVKVDFTFEESSLSKLAHDDAGAKRAKAESAPTAEEKPQEETPIKEEVVKPEEIEVTKPQVIDVPRPDIKVPNPVLIPTYDEPIVTSKPVEEAPVKVSEPARPSAPAPVKTTPAPSSTNSGSGSTTGTSTKPSTVDGSGGPGKGDAGTGAGRDKGNDGNAGAGNVSEGTGEYDGSGDGVFGRKVTYRDLSATKAAISVSGRVVTKICINRAGNVTFVELIPTETTIRDKNTLKLYLKAARGYKFQPDLTSPKEQCGKLSFKVDNSINNKLR